MSTNVPFFDAKRAGDQEEIAGAVLRVLRSGQYVSGAEVLGFESDASRYLGRRNAIGVSSGTDALRVALAALDIGHGDEVVIPAYTFFATAEAVLEVGATPVLVDIKPEDYTLDWSKVNVTPRTKAVVAVHLFGNLCEYPGGLGVPVIEDAAQAFGTPGVGYGIVQCYSCFPTKNLAAIGEAGFVTTDNAALAEGIRAIRNHGCKVRYEHSMRGANYKMDEVQAAVLRARIPGVVHTLARRAECARQYSAALGVVYREGSSYNQFVIRVADRDGTRARLASKGIGTEVYYPIPVSRQLALGKGQGVFLEADRAASESLALPIFPGITDEEISRVIEGLSGESILGPFA